MTVCELRKMFPYHDFYYFKDGHELRKAPFFHATFKSFSEINADTVFIYF